MKRVLVLFLLFNSIMAFSQKDSVVFYVNDSMKFSQIFSDNRVDFYRNGQITGSWVYEDSIKMYYSGSDLNYNYREIRVGGLGDTIICQMLDSLGNWEHVWTKVDYISTPTFVFPSTESQNVLIHPIDGGILIKTPSLIRKVELYDIQGRMIFSTSPYTTDRALIATPYKGVILVRVYYGMYAVTEKIELF